MSFISVMEAKLPPGFRFHPKDEELVCDYLAKKVGGNNTWSPFEYPMLVEVDLNKIEPWDLPEMACVGGKEWYFFSLRDRKYATGLRTNRATLSGYWKATGKDRRVVDVRKGTLVGMRKTLVFYQGRAPKGRKTDWVMHEFRLEGQLDSQKISSKEDWVLCRVFYKNRGMSGKHSEENCYDDTGSSLPPLMDPYLTFDQAPLNLEGFEQVPCFSSLSQDQNSLQTSLTTFPADLSQVDPTVPTKSLHQPAAEAFPDDMALFPADQPFCEKEVIKAVLDHLNKQAAESDGKPLEVVASPSLGEGTSVNYFPDLGFNILWNHCMFPDLIN